MRTTPTNHVEHRPWPLPAGSWVMRQSWRDLLFAHWPLPLEQIRRLVPDQLAVDTFDGRAWISVVPFRMVDVMLRGVPALPWLSAFPELNVRTYVTVGGKPGVYFFSLDAGNPLMVAVARRWFQVPYYNARMMVRADGNAIHYTSIRTHRGAAPVEFEAQYQPVAPAFHASPGTLDYWLAERYCFYTLERRGRIYRGEVHHQPWPLQPAQAEITVNTLAAPYGITLPSDAPVLHFARRLDVVAWRLQDLS